MPRVELEGDHLVLRDADAKTAAALVKEWDGWSRQPNGIYQACNYPSSLLGPEADPAVGVAVDVTTTRGGADIDTPTAKKPFPHQLAAIQELRKMLRTYGGAQLHDDMGLGKTATSLWSYLDIGAVSLTVVCPVSVKHNWKREIIDSLGLPSESIFILEGSPQVREKLARRANILRSSTSNPQPSVVIVNYDLVDRAQKQSTVWQAMLANMVIFDEAHYLKNRSAKRTRACSLLSKHAVFRLLLTGTPVRNQVDDHFSQVEIARPGTWNSYAEFQRRYCRVSLTQFGATPRKVEVVRGGKNLDKLAKVISTLTVARRKDEVIELPPKLHTFPELELTPPFRRLYNAMRDYAMLELAAVASEVGDGDEASVFSPRARSGIEAALRCEQIAQGFVGSLPDPLLGSLDPRILKHVDRLETRPNDFVFPTSPKIEWLVEQITGLLRMGGRSVVCFFKFNTPLFWFQRHFTQAKLGEVLHLVGDLSAEERAKNIDTFQENGGLMLCQVKLAEGFNLTQGQDVFFHGRDWSPAINRQAEDRCHRIGQTGTVNVQVPIVRGTIEMSIHKKLQRKRADADATWTIRDVMEAL